MLKQTLFVVISLCVISHLHAGCFPTHFFVESGAASPTGNSIPYHLDFPGSQGAGSPRNTAPRRLSQTKIAMIAVAMPAQTSNPAQTSGSQQEKPEPETVQVQS